MEDVFRAQPQPADVLYCAAGGNHAENGFFVDISAAQLDRCMKNNYYAALFPTKALFDIWTRQDSSAAAAAAKDQPRRIRRVVFVSSAAAFVSLPGSVAYSRRLLSTLSPTPRPPSPLWAPPETSPNPLIQWSNMPHLTTTHKPLIAAKCALRSLADTLRLEALRYSCESATYSIHIAFPGDFVSPGFYLEQDTKTPLTKRMQGTDCSVAELETRFPTADQVAAGICGAVDRGEFIICAGSASASLLFTGMIGPSPKRGLGLFDSVVGVVIGWLVWPVLRRRWERWCKADSMGSK